MADKCTEEARIRRNEEDIQDLWKHRETDRSANERGHERMHERIDAMKNWVIAGMGSMMLYFGVVFIQFVLNWISESGTTP
jgi:hypothetical protein